MTMMTGGDSKEDLEDYQVSEEEPLTEDMQMMIPPRKDFLTVVAKTPNTLSKNIPNPKSRKMSHRRVTNELTSPVDYLSQDMSELMQAQS